MLFRSCGLHLQSIDTHLEDAARTLGASELRIFFRVTLPLALPGLVAGAVLSFARSLGEFGATIMIAGNIPGKTQTIPLAIYFAAESNDLQTAGIYVGIISIVTFGAIYWLNTWTKSSPESASKRGGH